MKRYSTFLFALLFPITMYSQQNLSADELFLKARTAAFEQKDYPASIALAKEALEKAPNYTDISVFLGRLYTWNKDLVSARAIFEELGKREIQDEDYFLAYASLEYWNDQNTKAIEIIDKGLSYHAKSETLLLLKAKVYFGKDNYEEADKAVSTLLFINPKNTEARALAVRINELTSKNAIGIVYNYSHFDKQFDNDWHIVGVSYKRVTPIGSVIVRGNYANKFAEGGTQIELEAYPRLSKMFYLYVGGGYSDDVGLFPKYRTGVSLNANLPHSFEAELGYRQLYFSSSIWMYTAAIGKYYKNFWFNLRTYITPDSKNISHSYTGTVRYYTKGAQDYFAFQIGTGISPEENRNNLLENETFKLKTFKIGGEYNFSYHSNLFSVGTMYYNQEYRPGEKGNQFDITLGYTRKF
ncbi:YaiO family outer membrane beta-barrel protein [Chryseobacterium sp. D764]|jgi:YaiO family outer membrane protein|uniref:YaiO family outer membrane beta-barrel protein n=1 Tax=unclassified Chryseobacterium TaxID=2593645 RepID=UPI0015C21F6A|nr:MULTISPECIES: YaiO family outer membrane beta-barrel protein [unclassified Chryseobacterium]QXU50236.1 YaiO family outer membrane beta-barrel protein [Chryseobacterium sp. D764]CAD0218677.1 TPR_REGION domain-containing protein [Chryseobacterium sp. JV274]